MRYALCFQFWKNHSETRKNSTCNFFSLIPSLVHFKFVLVRYIEDLHMISSNLVDMNILYIVHEQGRQWACGSCHWGQ